MKRHALLSVLVLGLGATGTRDPGVAPHVSLPPDSTRYEVAVAMAGYSGLATSKNCDAITNRQGYDSLVGSVGGIEQPPQPDEDMEYEGTVRRYTNIDYCMTNSANKWCVATLRGASRMVLHVTVYGEKGRGAWLKAEAAPGPADSLSVRGNCDQSDMDEIKRDYPSGESGGSPDGQAIAENGPKFMFANHLARLRDSTFYPSKLPDSPWNLRVISKVP
jgi:hypothetical protein